PEDEVVWIHQNAWFHLGSFDKDVATKYTLKSTGNGVYMFVLSGEIMVGSQQLNTRDGLGVWKVTHIDFKALRNSEVLLMEVPMEV
ncbi:MAG: pirin family protein, partial [Saprospiraceae bacterium]